MTAESNGHNGIEARWRRLGWRRRVDLVVRGNPPQGTREAITVLGYARGMLRRRYLWAILAGISAFVVVLGLELFIGGEVTTSSLILGGAVAAGVGLGLELGGRVQARRLHRRAEAVLAESSIE